MHGKRSKFVQGLQILYEIENQTKKNMSIELSRNSADKYTFSSCLYREIIGYCLISGTTNYFRSEKIAEYILKINVYHRDYYSGNKAKTTIPNRIESIARTIKQYLSDLTQLEILDTRPAITQNKQGIKEYKFTYFGKLIALLIELEKTETRKIIRTEKISDEIYNLLKLSFEVSRSSVDLFCLIMYKKLVEKNIFNIVIHHYKDVLKDPHIKNKMQFLHSLGLIQSERGSTLEFWRIYRQSLDELKNLDYKKYKIFLFNLKQKLETLHQIKCRAFFSFEKWRYDNREIESVAVMEGYCDNCKLYTTGPAYIKHYLENYFSENKISEICPECNIDILDFEIIVEDKE
jgi:hypothetical protein